MTTRFSVTVTQTKEYIIEIDENVFTDEFLKTWREVFYPIYDIEGHAEHVATMCAKFNEAFVEGYGVLMKNGSYPWYPSGHNFEGVNVIPDGESISTEVEEI